MELDSKWIINNELTRQGNQRRVSGILVLRHPSLEVFQHEHLLHPSFSFQSKKFPRSFNSIFSQFLQRKAFPGFSIEIKQIRACILFSLDTLTTFDHNTNDHETVECIGIC